MSKETCSKFVAQYPINFLRGDIEQIEKIVKSILDTTSYRLYKHKNWIKLEGKNHYIYNDDIYSQEFRADIESYLINLIAMKGK